MRRSRWIVPVLVIAVLGLGAAFMFFGRGKNPVDPPSSAARTPITVTGSTTESPAPSPSPAASSPTAPGPALLVHTSDPDEYASSVAAFLFSFDTRGTSAEDYRVALLAEADPLMTDTGLADLEVMVDDRIPDSTQWSRMQANSQWSTWSQVAAWEPETWAEVVTSGRAEPGWAMRNVTGTQTTFYVEAGSSREAVSEPTVTIGMRCPAPDADVDRCYLTLIGTTVVP